ncbi:MAG: TonB-dependent receptor [Pseudomonadota bacterium]
MIFQRRVVFIAGLLATVALHSTSFAQEANEASENTDDDRVIIVTGTKQNISIQKEEASVAVITQRAIEDQALFDFRDALLRTANVSTLGGDTINNLSIRGVQLSGVGFTGSGATAQVYVDGAPSSFNGNQGAANLWDVAQVEILRGPQSTIQGRNALSGAVVINTADPEYEWGVRARGIVGTENTYRASAMVTGPIIADQLAFRLAADYSEQDFEVTNELTGDNALFQEALTLRGKLLFEPEFAPGLRLELTASYVDTDFGEFGTVNAPAPVTDPSFADFDPLGDVTFNPNARMESNKVWRGIANLEYDVSDNWTLIGIGTIEDVNRFTVFGANGFSESQDRVYSGEARAAFDYGNISGWIGGYYFDAVVPNELGFAGAFDLIGVPTDPAGSTFLLASTQVESTENYAIFGDVSIELSEKWSINLGARYDWETFTNTGLTGDITVDPSNCVVAPFLPGIGGLPCAALIPVSNEPPTTADFEAFLPRASVTYNFDEDRSLAFVVARGYRAGGSIFFAGTGGAGTTVPFDPEFLTNYELALRTQWFDQRLTVNANIFFTDWSDQQVSVPGTATTSPFNSIVVNAGTSELYGLELDASFEATPELDLFASAGLLSAEFTNFPFAVDFDGNPTNPADPTFANLAGFSFPAAPEFNASAGFSYRSDSGFFATATGSYTSSQFSDVTNLEANESEDLFLVNARVGYRTGPFEMAVFANNLFDSQVLTRQGRFTVAPTGGFPAPNGNPFFVRNDPQVIGVQAGVNF